MVWVVCGAIMNEKRLAYLAIGLVLVASFLFVAVNVALLAAARCAWQAPSWVDGAGLAWASVLVAWAGALTGFMARQTARGRLAMCGGATLAAVALAWFFLLTL
jgi:hypothetical protein